MQVNLGRGYRPDAPGTLIHGVASTLILGAAKTTPRCLSRLSATVRNQARSSACVAFATEAAFLDRAICQGSTPLHRGAELWTYYQGRKAEGGGAETRDEGSLPSLVVHARFAIGVPQESFWPYSDALVLDAPPPEAMQHAYDQRGRGKAHRCADGGEHREADICAAIDADFPVTIGIQVDQAFEDLTGGLWTLSGPSLGGHMLEGVAYDDAGLWVRNSWDNSWGEPLPPSFPRTFVDDDGLACLPPLGGFGHVAWATVLDPELTTDCYAISLSDGFSEDSHAALRPLRVYARRGGVRRGHLAPRGDRGAALRLHARRPEAEPVRGRVRAWRGRAGSEFGANAGRRRVRGLALCGWRFERETLVHGWRG